MARNGKMSRKQQQAMHANMNKQNGGNSGMGLQAPHGVGGVGPEIKFVKDEDLGYKFNGMNKNVQAYVKESHMYSLDVFGNVIDADKDRVSEEDIRDYIESKMDSYTDNLMMYKDDEYDGLNSDPRVLDAIDSLYDGDVSKEGSDAYNVWANGYDEDENKVKSYLDKEYPGWRVEGGLNWGPEKLE